MGNCILGIIGECGTDTLEQRQLLTSQSLHMLDVINEKVSKTFSNARAASSNLQRLSCIVKNGDCIYDGVKMEQIVEINANTQQIINKDIKADNIIDSVIDAAISSYLDYINKGTSGGDRKTLSHTEIKAINEIRTQLKATLKDEDFMQCTATSINEQIFEGKATNGNVIARLVDMKQTTTILTECIFNKIMNAAQNVTLSEETKTQLAAEEKIRKDNLASNISEATSSIFWTIAIAIIAFIVFLLIIFGVFLLRRYRKKINV
jgi:hypothetical protein